MLSRHLDERSWDGGWPVVGAGWNGGVSDSASWVRQGASSSWDWDSGAGAGRNASAGSSGNDSECGAGWDWDFIGSWEWQINKLEQIRPAERSGRDGTGEAKENEGGELHLD